MKKKEDKLLSWSAEKASYARFARAILKRDIRILDGDNRIAPGYTAPDDKIYICQEDDLWKDKTELEKYTYRKGIITHELGHQLFTNFDKEKFVMMGMPRNERQIFSSIANILEDPAIEFLLQSAVGGPMLSALHFAIVNTYKDSPRIEEVNSAFGQLVAALIQYGDMGVLKGRFTYPEAKTTFLDIASLFYQGIFETNSGKRVDISKEIFDKTRPLWEPELKRSEEEAQAFLDALKELLDKLGKSESSGNGTGSSPSDKGLTKDEKKSARQKSTVIKVSKEVFDALKEMAQDGDSNGSGSGAGIQIECEDEGEEGSSKDSRKSKESNGQKGPNNKDSSPNSANNSENSNDTSDTRPYSQNQTNPEGHRESPRNDDGKIDMTTPGKSVECSGDGEISDEEYELSDEDIAYIKREAERIQNEFDKTAELEDDSSLTLENFEIETPSLSGLTCLNNNITNTSSDISNEYQALLGKYGPQIRTTTNQLKKIFEQDYEDKEHRSRGRVSIKRAFTNDRITSRIFDRRISPTGKRDVAVAILVDESGSMSGHYKYAAARESCIALAEIFAKLDIPVYVIGFTADEQGHDIVHNHYIKWKNSQRQRETLLNISARSNNCDGYSIRYITKLLKKHKATHKLLIVLSDGQPAASAYGWGGDGVADTKAAIREAKKNSHVLGVAIGNSDTQTIQDMYEKNFLHISQASDLFIGLVSELKKIFKNI